MKNPAIGAPTLDSLPKAANRRRRCGPPMTEFRVAVETVTPILGGSAMTRQFDETEIIRPSTIRGHLRFWWRVLNAHRFDESKQMCERESEIWGSVAFGSRNDQNRSSVEIRVSVEKASEVDYSAIDLNNTFGAYALWPAREEKRSRIPTAPRRKEGTSFNLIVSTPTAFENEIIETIKAWISFGGYGSRVRRGLGSFTVKASESSTWLSGGATRNDLTVLFGRDVFDLVRRVNTDTPVFAGAALQVLNPPSFDATTTWTTALNWLRDFRQGTKGSPGNRARESGPQLFRPSVSNWPEPDKIRHLTGKTTVHVPRYSNTPAWPRAGFGLPINVHFQDQSRQPRLGWTRNSGLPRNLRWNEINLGTEPRDVQLVWQSPGGLPCDRLASPLIVKALPLADRRFVACALWLDRSYPDGDVVLKGIPHSGAPFDQLVAEGDASLFSPIKSGISLRTAFLDWLDRTQNTTVVAP